MTDYDIILHNVTGYGIFPVVMIAGSIVYRGEYRPTHQEALAKAEEAIARFSQAREALSRGANLIPPLLGVSRVP